MKTEHHNNNDEEENFSNLEKEYGVMDTDYMYQEIVKVFNSPIKENKNSTVINDSEVYCIKENKSKSTMPDSSNNHFNNLKIEKCTQKNEKHDLENKETVSPEKAVIIDAQKENKRKTYENKKEKRKSKKIFAVIEKDGFKKKKEIIRRNENKKVGYTTKIKSRRVDNIKDKMGRNTIQEIIPNWINYKEKDFNNILQKLNPSKIKDIDKLKNVSIEEIFKLDITLKGKIDKLHNINIINSNVNSLKKIKFKFTLIEIINVIIDKNKREQILSKKMPELKEKEERERKALINEFFEGLKEIEEYLNDIDGSTCYKNKLKKAFLDFSMLINYDK